MITGKKHTWCGNINWNGEETCKCPAFNWSQEYKDKINYTDVFETVEFDHPALEKLSEQAKIVAQNLNLNVDIGFDPSFENADGIIQGAVILDGFLYIYPEKIVSDSIVGVVEHDGFALDNEVVYHNYPHEPDDVDYKRINQSTHIWSILSEAFRMLFMVRLDNTLEGMMMDEMYKEEQEEL